MWCIIFLSNLLIIGVWKCNITYCHKYPDREEEGYQILGVGNSALGYQTDASSIVRYSPLSEKWEQLDDTCNINTELILPTENKNIYFLFHPLISVSPWSQPS